jgi:trehalose utilization protein
LSESINVIVWDERTAPTDIYPEGINAAVASYLSEQPGLHVRTAQLSDADQGLGEESLAVANVLIWWSHAKNRDVTDENAERVVRHVRERGMGFIPMHSSIHAKPFLMLMQTSCNLEGWREDGKPMQIYTIEPMHAIATGLPKMFVVQKDEMYCERFDVPPVEELVFISSFAGGEVFRSGCCWTRGKGRIFYWSPGHETYPVYFDNNIRHVIANAVRWCAGGDQA